MAETIPGPGHEPGDPVVPFQPPLPGPPPGAPPVTGIGGFQPGLQSLSAGRFYPSAMHRRLLMGGAPAFQQQLMGGGIHPSYVSALMQYLGNSPQGGG